MKRSLCARGIDPVERERLAVLVKEGMIGRMKYLKMFEWRIQEQEERLSLDSSSIVTRGKVQMKERCRMNAGRWRQYGKEGLISFHFSIKCESKTSASENSAGPVRKKRMCDSHLET